jgi:S1-C subfamily serine protease
MSTRPRSRLAFLMVALAAACRRDVDHLDEVQKMAYGVKPAVVRISALATGEFHYNAEALAAAERQLRKDGYNFTARDVKDDFVETGAGGSGSGFIIHPNGFILTSGHVVAPTRDRSKLEQDLARNGAIAALLRHFPTDGLRALYRDDRLDRYIAPFAIAGQIKKLQVVNEVELSNGEKLPFRIRRYSPSLNERGTDLAVVQVERTNLPVLKLGDSDASRVGESIWSVGYPAVASSGDEIIGGWLSRDSDLEATFNPGTITAIKRNVNNTPVLQSNVAIYRGNSGGPAVNREGQVIGIATWGHTDAEAIKFLVPINVAKDLLSEAGIPNAEGEFNRHYDQALADASKGRWADAQKRLLVAASLFPNSPDLSRFRRDTERGLQAQPFWLAHPVMSSAASSILVLAIVGTVALFVTARRMRGPRELLLASTVETLVAPERSERPPTLGQQMLGKFTILNGARAGEKLGLGGSGIRIGRESTICEIVLENPKVSRLHAEVVSIDGKVLLIDRNSSNGTYVNDQKIDKRFLKDGDIIYFGGRNAIAVAFHV